MTAREKHIEHVRKYIMDEDSYSIAKPVKEAPRPTIKSCGNNIKKFRKEIRDWYANR